MGVVYLPSTVTVQHSPEQHTHKRKLLRVTTKEYCHSHKASSSCLIIIIVFHENVFIEFSPYIYLCFHLSIYYVVLSSSIFKLKSIHKLCICMMERFKCFVSIFFYIQSISQLVLVHQVSFFYVFFLL